MKPANPAKLNIYLSPQHGGQQLVEMRLQNTHKQWILHNSKVHCDRLGVQVEHLEIFKKMEDLMITDPEKLLPQHIYWLGKDVGATG